MESNKNVFYIGMGILAVAVLIFMLLPEGILRPLLYLLLFLGSIFLVLLVLIQRGRGGGLAGALGGMGGYSAFGTRAGDIFTRVTIIAAAIWILGAMALARLNLTTGQIYVNPGASAPADGRTPGSGDSSAGAASDEGIEKGSGSATSESSKSSDN